MWDWAAGQDFITKISDALDRCGKVVALWSAEYFNPTRYTRREWSAAFVDPPGADEGRLVPVRVEDVPGHPPGERDQDVLHSGEPFSQDSFTLTTMQPRWRNCRKIRSASSAPARTIRSSAHTISTPNLPAWASSSAR